MNNNLLILGAGGHGKVVLETAEAMKKFGKIDFLDDQEDIAIGKLNDFKDLNRDYSYAFVAMGNNEVRLHWLEQLKRAGYELPVLTHPTAYVSPFSKIKEGTIILVSAVVNANVKVERGCIIGIGAIIDHDCVIEAGCHINTGTIVTPRSHVVKGTRTSEGKVFIAPKEEK